MFESVINKTSNTLVERLDAVSYNVGYYDIMSLNLPNWATSFIQSQADLSIYADLLYLQSKQYYILSAEDTEEFKDLLRSRMLFSKEYLVENCQKSVKFALNSLLRPRNILKFFVFSNKLQVNKSEILHFLSFFSHYSYFIEKLKVKIISDNRSFITVHQFSDMIAAIDDAYIQSLNIDGFMSIMSELFDFFGEDGFIPAEAAIMFFDDKKLNHIATSIFSDFLTQNKTKLTRQDLSELLKRLFVRADVIEFDDNELNIHDSSSDEYPEDVVDQLEVLEQAPITEEITSNIMQSDSSLEFDLSNIISPDVEDVSTLESNELANDIDLSEFDFTTEGVVTNEDVSDNDALAPADNLDISDFDTDDSMLSKNIASETNAIEDDEISIVTESDFTETIIDEVILDDTDSKTSAYEDIIDQNDLALENTLADDANDEVRFSLLNAHVKAENDLLSALAEFLPVNDADETDDYAPDGLIDSITMPNLSDNADIGSALSQFITEFNEINKDQLSNTDNPINESLSQAVDIDTEFSINDLSINEAIESDQATTQTHSGLTNFSAIEDEIEDLSSEFAAFSHSDPSDDNSLNISTNVGDMINASEDDLITEMLEDIDFSEYNSELTVAEPADSTQSAKIPDHTLINPKTHELKEAIAKETSLEEQIIDIGDVILAAKDSFNNNEIGENFTDMDEDIFLLELKQHYNEESDEIC